MNIKKIDKNMAFADKKNDQLCQWIDLNNSNLRGTYEYNGFTRIKEEVFISPNIEYLKTHTSGLNITFKTDSTSIRIKAQVGGASYMAHMTSCGQIGFDLYYKDNGKFKFINTTKVNKSEYEVIFIENLKKEVREYRLYFPLYIGVKEAFIGIDKNASLEFIKNKQDKVVIYGTSISQGGCATRPGMSYTNILDRKTDYEFINLGFSGSAHLESQVIDILNTIEMKCLILEVEANNTSENLHRLLPDFISKLKTEKIILISHFPSLQTVLFEGARNEYDANKQLQREIKKIIFLDGESLLGDLDFDATVDGVHLTDLGFYHLAEKLIEHI